MRKFTNIFRIKRKNNISLILSALCLLMAASCLSAHESNAVESSLQGHIVDIEHQTVYPGEIKIADIVRLSDVDASAPYYLPGFIDGHIHIESSMLTPRISHASPWLTAQLALWPTLTKSPTCLERQESTS